MGELDEVVEEAHRAAAERHEQNGERGNLVLGDREERHGRGDEDEQTAHRRRALLAAVRLGAFFPDVLAELIRAQEADEPRSDDDRDDHREDPGGEDSDHAVATLLSSSAIASSPTARDALTRTASPGRTTSSSERSASWTFATQRPVTPASR